MKSPQMSLRKRLMLLVGGGLLALLIAQYIATALVLDERQEEMIDAVLAEQMHYSMQLYHTTGNIPDINVPQLDFFAWKISDTSPKIPSNFLGKGPGSHETYINNHEYHFVIHDENGMRFLLAYDVESLEDEFTALMLTIGVTSLLSALLAILGIYWLSGKVLNDLTTLAKNVHTQDDKILSNPYMDAEVYALATALDDYRAKQSLLLAKERDFSGYLSHELRTPLSVVRGQAEMLQMQLLPPQQDRAHSIILQVDHMRRLIEQLLQLARRSHIPKREPVNLHALVERLWKELSQESTSLTQLENTLPTTAQVLADPLLVELVLRNAFANARLHADGAILKTHLHNQVLVIEDVRNDAISPIVLPDDSAEGSTEGSAEGIGLAILKRACLTMGWSFTITPQPTGLRLTFNMTTTA